MLCLLCELVFLLLLVFSCHPSLCLPSLPPPPPVSSLPPVTLINPASVSHLCLIAPPSSVFKPTYLNPVFKARIAKANAELKTTETMSEATEN